MSDQNERDESLKRPAAPNSGNLRVAPFCLGWEWRAYWQRPVPLLQRWGNVPGR
jgi:hypothetical protein